MKKYEIRNRWMHLLSAFCCAVLLASCYSEDDMDGCFPTVDEGGKATVRIGITAERPDESVTRATTEEGGAHEYMNELCVLIVNDAQQLVMQLRPDLSEDAAAQSGDLQRWTSDPIELTPGTYTLYAVANWKGLNNKTLNSLSSDLENTASFSTWLEGLRTLQVEDPARTIDLSDAAIEGGTARFIPMSGQAVATVTASTTLIEVALDRLVSKVRLMVPQSTTSVTFSDYADRVSLFETNADPESTDYEKLNVTHTFSPATTDETTTVDMYVNPTYSRDEGFTVALTTDRNDLTGVTAFSGTTARKQLPRNHIYPIVLDFVDYSLQLEGSYSYAPIGVLPVEVEIAPQENTFEVEIPLGAYFNLTVSDIWDATGTPVAAPVEIQWTAEINEDGSTPGFGNLTANGAQISGYLTAVEGTTLSLNLKASWTDTDAEGQEQRLSRSYILLIHAVDIPETLSRSSVRNSSAATTLSRQWEGVYLKSEIMYLFMKK